MENKSLTQNISASDVLMSQATDFENIAINLESLGALLQLYSEHREEELEILAMDGAAAGAIKMYLDRDRMADALMTAIQDKLRFLQNMADLSTAKAYDQARIGRTAASKQGTA